MEDYMTQSEVVTVLQDAVYTVIISAAPMLITAMVVGLIVSIFQATTQINEQTLAFVPKIVGVLVVFVLAAGFIMSTISDFTVRLYESIVTVMA